MHTLEIVFALILACLLLDQMPSAYELEGSVIVMGAVASSMFFRKKEA
ncbi:MAG: hypothetical protein AB7U31_04125 [Synergistaceae bacterium]